MDLQLKNILNLICQTPRAGIVHQVVPAVAQNPCSMTGAVCFVYTKLVAWNVGCSQCQGVRAVKEGRRQRSERAKEKLVCVPNSH